MNTLLAFFVWSQCKQPHILDLFVTPCSHSFVDPLLACRVGQEKYGLEGYLAKVHRTIHESKRSFVASLVNLCTFLIVRWLCVAFAIVKWCN